MLGQGSSIRRIGVDRIIESIGVPLIDRLSSPIEDHLRRDFGMELNAINDFAVAKSLLAALPRAAALAGITQAGGTKPAGAGTGGNVAALSASQKTMATMLGCSEAEYAAELELRYALFFKPGKMRFFAWVNRAIMGGYAETVALPIASPNYPDITLTRRVSSAPSNVPSSK